MLRVFVEQYFIEGPDCPLTSGKITIRAQMHRMSKIRTEMHPAILIVYQAAVFLRQKEVDPGG